MSWLIYSWARSHRRMITSVMLLTGKSRGLTCDNSLTPSILNNYYLEEKKTRRETWSRLFDDNNHWLYLSNQSVLLPVRERGRWGRKPALFLQFDVGSLCNWWISPVFLNTTSFAFILTNISVAVNDHWDAVAENKSANNCCSTSVQPPQQSLSSAAVNVAPGWSHCLLQKKKKAFPLIDLLLLGKQIFMHIPE